MQPEGRLILEPERFSLTLIRLAHQLVEMHGDFSSSCILGIQPRGVLLSNHIYTLCKQIIGLDISYGKLDITFYRDDFRTRQKPLKAYENEVEFLVENKRVILVDDVLYTGRTIQAAMTSLQHYGRPASVELLVLIDRRFNRHLPVQANFVGMRIDAVDEAYVEVQWDQAQGHQVMLYADKTKKHG